MTDLDADVLRLKPIRLDLTPLVDVIFLLLIFFMVSTTFKEDQGIELALPEANSASAAEQNELRVRLDKDGGIYFQDRKVELTALEPAVRKALATVDKQFVVVEADTSAQHGAVVRVMDALRKAGAEGLTVATEGAQPGG